MIEEDFCGGNSLIHRLDPRVKILVACAFSIVVAISNRLPALLSAVLISLVLVALARLPFKSVFSRLLVVNTLIFLFWIFIPFTIEGERLFGLGPLIATREGIIFSALITIKSNSIILVLMGLVSTMPVLWQFLW